MNQQTDNLNRVGIAQMIGAMVLSGIIGVFVVESQQPVINVVFFRCLIGGFCLGLFCWAKGYFRREYFTRRHTILMVLGAAFLVANWLMLFESFALTSITVATIVYHTQPFFILILGSLIFRERLGLASIGWTILAFIGVVLIAGVDSAAFAQGDGYLLGVFYALGAAFCYGVATLIVKELKGVKPHIVAFVQVALGAVAIFPLARFDAVVWEFSSFGWLIGMGVIFTCILYILLYSAYGKLKVAQIAVLSFIYPAVAVIVDYLVYHYTISPMQFAGMALVGISSYCLNRNKAK